METTESKHNEKILPVFVTLDPQRDTPSHLHAYLKGLGFTSCPCVPAILLNPLTFGCLYLYAEFDSRILGLTGTASAMRQMAQEYRVYFKKVQEDGEDYLVDTSHNMYLINPKMEIVRCFGVEYNPDELSQELLKEVASVSQ
jgi:protein SCO1/2